MSNEKDMHKTSWKHIELPPYLKEAREEQERLNREVKDKDAGEKDLKLTTAEEYMEQDLDEKVKMQ